MFYLFIYLFFQTPKKLKSTIATAINPKLVACDGHILFCVGAELLAKLPRPATLNGWGKVLLVYFGLYYIFRLAYPTSLQRALLIIQKMYIDQDISKADWAKAKCEKSKKEFQDFIKK